MPHRTGRVFRTRLTAGLPGEWVSEDGKRRKRFDPLHTPYSVRHTFASWHYCVHKDLLSLRDEVGGTTTRMAEKYAKRTPDVYQPEILAWWNGEVDLGLAEVEAVARKICAMPGWDQPKRRREAS